MIRNLLRSFRILAMSVPVLLFHQTASTQDNLPREDSLRQYTISEVVITANRYENKILNTGSAVSSLHLNELRTLPAETFSDALIYLPGIHIASTDGMGLDPQISLRGFYGGGEAEYVKVLVDGIPVNNLENGLANWNMMPLGQVDQVELLRGGSSPLYGDAAMGGVINIRTDQSKTNYARAKVEDSMFNT